LKRNEIAYLEITHTDKRARDYPSIQQEMLTKPRQIGQCKWLVMKSRDFKKAIMKLSTKRGNAIREYYLNVEDLLRLYVEYDKRFELRQREEEMKRVKMEKTRLEILLDEIKTQNDKLLDEAANASRERNTLISQNNDLQQDVTEIGRGVLRDRSTVRNENGSYCSNGPISKRQKSETGRQSSRAIRAQIVSIAKALRVQRLKDPMLNVILEIDIQPNTKALYNNIKEALMEDGVRFIRNGCSLIDSIVTEQQLIERMTEVNEI
jgi:MSV199 domain/Protein of unknown function (DUF3627)